MPGPTRPDGVDASGAPHWDAVYGTKAEDAVSWFQQEPTTSLRLLDEQAVPPTASVVDVGGGASRLVEALLTRGFDDVTVLDISQRGLAQARRRLGAAADTVTWVVADVTHWQPSRTYDVWHDRAVLHFLTDPADVARYRAVVEQTVAAQGLVIVATFAPDGPETCSGLPVQRYDAESLGAVLGEGWTMVAQNRQVHRTPWGAEQPFTWLALRRRRHG
jgi:2-polyprenyl-3-methyl-5-hydroxy-6-metoxy-1,4-benzoquinol methylase